MPDRDQHVDRLLREAMAGPVRAESADCLDVEALAAWAEGSLDAGHRARAEAHAATCTRCQSMLAAMIRTAPIPAATPASPFRKWLVMLGPALGVAAAVALWFAVDRPSRTTEPEVMTMARSDNAPGRTAQEERKVGAEPSAAEPQAPIPTPATTPSSSFREREADKALADADRAPRGELDALSKSSGRAAAAKKRDVPSDSSATARRADAAESSRLGAVAGALPPETPPPPPPAAPRPSAEPQRLERVQAEQQPPRQSADPVAVQQVNQLPPPPFQQQQQNVGQQNAGQRNAPPQNAPQQNAAPTNQTAAGADQRANEKPAAAAPATIVTTSQPADANARVAGINERVAGRGGGAGGGGFARGISPVGMLDVPSPVPLVRYRVVDGRTIQRSVDGGGTWTTGRTLTPPTMVVAGASPSPTVCWLAATGGVVLTTADGVTWRDLKVSEPGEIKSIAAVDALNAIVTMTDGRTLTTTTGGASWARPK